ncbi:DUF1214 domain-containing protein [Sediminitomix flava]|uniref:DUF1254 domain-containing protein n=1 Tax=Sediminitomix flava TaxID=379075 RepID=A0A315ZAL6_SEDFL|nr:DUF1214 domain-containing protein [Sediminitomix flava]PWJ41764.1 hypothetical protein BC781_10314 [Sediminitomix flava]
MIALAFASCQVQSDSNSEASTAIEYEKSGYLTDASVSKMYDEMAFHGATQSYLWGTSVMVNQMWRLANLKVGGPLDFVTYNTPEQKYNIITSNLNTPYMVAFPNLEESGPLILEIPEGKTGGIINDIESRWVADLGLAGKDLGKGAKYLILHEKMEEPANHDADFVIRVRTNLFWIGTRILVAGEEETKRLQEGHKLYPLGAEPDTKVLNIGNTYYEGWWPEGYAFWEGLHEVVQIEDFPEETRYILQFLKRVGIEKGKPFNPTAKQKEILIKAAEYGKAMAEALSNGRDHLIEPFYGEGSKYTVHLGGLTNPIHYNEEGNYKELDGLASYTYEAFSMSEGMMKNLIGVGSKYLASYKDADGAWLDGSNTYQITIPADVPMKQFWSFIVYSQATRCFVQNKDRRPGVTSREELEVNSDGSVTITIGPSKPEGVLDNNFIYSNPDEGWFTYFRIYAPTEKYFDKTWVLPAIERVK